MVYATPPLPPGPDLVSYRHFPHHRDRWGNWEYMYSCTWSDGTTSLEVAPPWGERMKNAVYVSDLKDAS